MRKVMVFTATRAEYGLLKPVIRRLVASPRCELILVAGGDHLSAIKGNTVEEIINDGFQVQETIIDNFLGDTPAAVVKAVARSTSSFADIIERQKPDLLLLLGDRYELLAPATCALLHRIPIAHIGGGETTFGVLDEQVRHALTKMAHLHFVSTWEYGWRVRQMGEEAWRISVAGALGIENIRRRDFMSPQEIYNEFDINPDLPTLLITYHPETLTNNRESVKQIRELIAALKEFPMYQQVVTYPGTEVGYLGIIEAWKEYAAGRSYVKLYPSLGSRGYLGVMSLAAAVVGNSSSGIIEAPSFHVPTVNIGDRQKGRIRADSIIDVPCEEREIVRGIKKALEDRDFRRRLKGVVNPYDPYGDGNVSGRIVKVLEEIPINRKLLEKRLDFPEPEEKRNYHVR
jgi:UDP-hydrolysing UDP-N-acetyl-D-glucosamine 2-epimerase